MTKLSLSGLAVFIAVGFGTIAFGASFTPTGPTSWSSQTANCSHATMTVLTNGKVLIAGGGDPSAPCTSADLYDPATGTSTATGPLLTGRTFHTATLLPNGKVLFAGGYVANFSASPSAELYDPATGKFTSTGSLVVARVGHAAASLADGTVLLYGGDAGTTFTAETYNPTTGTFSSTGLPHNATGAGTLLAVRLPNGNVLAVLGGGAEIYNPTTRTFTSTGSLISSSDEDTATLLGNGKVLLVGAGGAELYDPSAGSFSKAATMLTSQSGSGAALLDDGRVLITGGTGSSVLYDPLTNSWSVTDFLNVSNSVPVMAKLPNGKVLVYRSDGWLELYDPAGGKFNAVGKLAVARHLHQATLLSSGKVLITGGIFTDSNLNNIDQSSAEIYDPSTRTFSAAGAMSQARSSHAAVRLPNGKVLVVGGSPDYGVGPIQPADIYDPSTGLWSTTGTTIGHHFPARSALLGSGSVIVVGDGGDSQPETYDPASGVFTQFTTGVRNPNDGELLLLPTGNLLWAGGSANGNAVNNADLIDPAARMISPTGNMLYARDQFAATLAGGKAVMIGGGDQTDPDYGSQIETYDPATGQFSAGPRLIFPRYDLRATTLPDGRVLITGGHMRPRQVQLATIAYASRCELYDPASGTITPTSSMKWPRQGHTATLLPDGTVLVTGGYNSRGDEAEAEVYSSGLDPLSITPITGTTAGGTTVTITGVNFAAGAEVAFGGVFATNVQVVNSTTITATTPAHAAGTVNFTVMNANGTGGLTVSGFTFADFKPTISGVSPAAGYPAGGESVSISGTNFVSGATVTFGGLSAPAVNVVNGTTISATTPAHAAGPVDVVVRNPNGDTATLTAGFRYGNPNVGLSPGTVSIAKSNTRSATVSIDFAQTSATTVTLQSSSGTVTVPASVTINAGATSAAFTISAGSSIGSATITATLPAAIGGATASMTVNVVGNPPGDANGDGTVNTSDIFYLINYLFVGGPAPVAGDANGDGSVTPSDIFYLINYLFAGGPAPI